MADRYINSLQEFLNRNDLTDDQRREAEQELQDMPRMIQEHEEMTRMRLVRSLSPPSPPKRRGNSNI